MLNTSLYLHDSISMTLSDDRCGKKAESGQFFEVSFMFKIPSIPLAMSPSLIVAT